MVKKLKEMDFVKQWGNFEMDHEVQEYKFNWLDVFDIARDAYDAGIKAQRAHQRLETRKANEQAKKCMDR